MDGFKSRYSPRKSEVRASTGSTVEARTSLCFQPHRLLAIDPFRPSGHAVTALCRRGELTQRRGEAMPTQVTVRAVAAADWPVIWPIIRQVAAEGDTCPIDSDPVESEAKESAERSSRT